jgi:HSP20 family protein
MNMMRQEPWSMLRNFQQEMNRLMPDWANATVDNDDSSIVTGHWVPAVDIKEEPNQFLIHVDLPGVNPENIDITMDNGVLMLKGARHWEKEEKRDDYRRTERVRGEFYRRFALPDTANPDGIRADYNNGVLLVSIPKQEKAQPRRITVGR